MPFEHNSILAPAERRDYNSPNPSMTAQTDHIQPIAGAAPSSSARALAVVGVHYRGTGLDLRDRLAFHPRELPDALRALCASAAIDEAVVLSTCNRVECYLAGTDPDAAARAACEMFAARAGAEPARLEAALVRRANHDAVSHLFQVASGLDSMVLGESEIAAQVKQAYLTAQDAGATGMLLNRLFQKALHAAKLIRTRTAVNGGPGSIGSVVAGLLRRLFGERLGEAHALLWGAGKAAETTVRHLTAAGIGQVWVVNRTQAKARELASLCSGGWLSWEQAQRHLAHIDVAIVCTQAPHYVIDPGDIESAQAVRGSRPLVIVDLSVPRNVDPAVGRMPGVTLYNIDDLQTAVDTTLASRRRAVASCRAMLSRQTEHFLRWWRTDAQENQPCESVTVS